MILEFLDGQQIEVIRILGGPRMIDLVTRDTLSIEADPSLYNIEELTAIFNDNTKTNKLYTYLENDDETLTKTEIGEGYNIFISARIEQRVIPHQPGKIVPTEYEEIAVVNIAQMTYEEYQNFLNTTPPNSES